MRAIIVAVLVLSACGATEPAEAAFNVSAVRSSFSAECDDPVIVDDMFCEQVTISGMSADGTTLIVPTTLNEAATARAEVICQQLARAHFDADGDDLGYASISVLDREGATAASCGT